MIIAKILVFLFKLGSMVVLVGAFVTENKLKEVWIWTPDNGNHDHWATNVFNYYTNLKDFQLNFIQEKHLNLSVLSFGTSCYHRFVLLSERSDLQTSNYYELYLTYENVGFRRGNDYTNILVFPYGPAPISGNEFREYRIQWNNHGEVTVYNGYSSTAVIMSNPVAAPFEIHGVGIKTGYGDQGLWKVQHSGEFTGYFCVKHQTYGNMDIWMTTTEPRLKLCAVLCSRTTECIGMNYNNRTKQCELIRSGQLVVKVTAQGWTFSTKCLNEKSLCLASF